MFAEYLKTKEITFKHAKGCRDIFGKEFHAFHEIFLLVGNTARFTSDNLIDEIGANALVIIPKHHFHQFDHMGDEKDYHRYVLQFETIQGQEDTVAAVFDCVKLICSIDPKTALLFQNLGSLIAENKTQSDKEALLRAYCTELLIDLKYNYSHQAVTRRITDPLIQKTIEYIDANFLRAMTIEMIAKHLHFSKTYISHKFKDVMHISIYRYILQKKLMHAHGLICSGTTPTEAAAFCGFDNYSGFYKLYKKYFGFSPSGTNKT